MLVLRYLLREIWRCRATIDKNGVMRFYKCCSCRAGLRFCIGMAIFFKIKDVIATVTVILHRNNVTTQTIERPGIGPDIAANCHFRNAQPRGRIAKTQHSRFLNKSRKFGNPFVFTTDPAH